MTNPVIENQIIWLKVQQNKITYLSHGQFEAGGYLHEISFCNALSDNLYNCDICYKEIRFRRNFRGIFGWITLFIKAFFSAKNKTVVTVARLAWPVYLRNVFNKNKIILVIHNFDENDGKNRLYFYLLRNFFALAARRENKVLIVVVSEYWKNNLQNNFYLNENILRFPNLFDNAKLQFYRDIAAKKSNLIHLGQWSEKIDKKAYRILIHELDKIGLACYFSDNTGATITDLPVSYFQMHEAYLKQMALSKATVILNSIAEGWNRVAHESFLVGTQVISTGMGGLEELVQLANGYIVSDEMEALDLLKSNLDKEINLQALERFNISESSEWIKPIAEWTKQ